MSSLRERVINELVRSARFAGQDVQFPWHYAESCLDEMTNSALLTAISDALEELIAELGKR